jgi:hypothetical protein
MDADQHAHQVDLDDGDHVFEGLIGERAATADPGVVVEQVELAVGRLGERRQRRAVVRPVGDVEPAHDAVLPAQFGLQISEAGLVDVIAPDEPALAGEQPGGLAAHAGRRPGDEDRLSSVGVSHGRLPCYRGASPFCLRRQTSTSNRS